MRLNDTIYTYYVAIANGNGYSINDEIVKVEQVNTLDDPTLILETKWFNQTTYLEIYQIVDPYDVDLQLNNSVTVLGGVGLTDAQLRATPVPILLTDGVDTAEVNTRTDGIKALEVSDDMTSAETFRQTLVASTDTTITFTQPVRLVRVKNESITATVFVRDGAISSDTPANAEMVGVAAVLNLPTTEYYPFKTSTVHVRSAGTPTVNITGFY